MTVAGTSTVRGRSLPRTSAALIGVLLTMLLSTTVLAPVARAEVGTGTITGTVMANAGDGPIPVCDGKIRAWYLNEDGVWDWDQSTEALTSPPDAEGNCTGNYTLQLPVDRTYHLSFSDNDRTYHVPTLYYPGASSEETADDIVVAPRSTRTVNVTLTRSGEITGTVMGSNGNPVPDVEVTAWYDRPSQDDDWAEMANQTTTALDGVYHIDLHAGLYRLEFTDPEGIWGTAWYGGTTNATSAEGAQDIRVKATHPPQSITDNIDVTLRYSKIVSANAEPHLEATDYQGDSTTLDTVRVDDEVEIVGGEWSADDETATVVYQWQRNGAAIAGAKYSAYEPTSTDVGKTISVRVTATAPKHEEWTRTLPLSAPVRVSVRCEYLLVPQQEFATAQRDLTKARQLVTDIQQAPSRLKTLTKQVQVTTKALTKANKAAKTANKKLATAKKKAKKAKKPAQLAKAKRALATAQKAAARAVNAARKAEKAAANTKAALAAHKRAMASYPSQATAKARITTAQQVVSNATKAVNDAVAVVGSDACA